MTGRLFTISENSRRFLCVEKGLGNQFLAAMAGQGFHLVPIDRTGPGSLSDCFEVLDPCEASRVDAACSAWLNTLLTVPA